MEPPSIKALPALSVPPSMEAPVRNGVQPGRGGMGWGLLHQNMEAPILVYAGCASVVS